MTRGFKTISPPDAPVFQHQPHSSKPPTSSTVRVQRALVPRREWLGPEQLGRAEVSKTSE